ncbi:MAG: hypothetical protein KDF60_06430 [Calditrichaeota bacterium]|nr:hypothetical protein [Calditrichota bacterium]
MYKHIMISLISVALLFSCQKQMKSGIDQTQMDKTVKPQDDFYEYMNGTWLKTFEIPQDKSNYGSFTKLADDAEKNLLAIIKEAAQAENKEPGSNVQKVGDMYLSFMDSTRAEELGMEPIRADLEQIAALANKDDVVKHMAVLDKMSVGSVFGAFVRQDDKNTTKYIVNFYQGGLSLPDKSYYLSDNEKFTEIRGKYVEHVQKMFEMTGYKNAAEKAKTVMEMETAIAENHWSRVENRDRNKTYNKFALVDLDKNMGTFKLAVFADESGFGSVDSVRVYQPSYFTALGKLYDKYSVEDWKTFLEWNLITAAAPYLSNDFVNEDFQFYQKVLSGVEQNRPRWKRAVSSVEGVLGEVVGKLYVERHFKPEAKERMVTLVSNLRQSFRERINTLEWMSAETKEKALAKLEKFNAKIGYPDKWKDYSALEIKADDLLGNLRRSALVEHHRQLDKLGKPIDREEWFMTPQTVNAYYSSSMNEVVFPAAILQPPFFNMDADDAVNYGGIGAVIGHELTHGFDDQGRKSDGDGNLNDWWTDEDAKKFEERAQVMIDQYFGYNPIDTMHVNGKLTLGENIADLGGLTISYYAYKNALAGKEAPVIDGYSGDQRFFLGWAQIWARKYRDDALRQRLQTDPHSPSEYRTNGIVSNMPEFYTAFNVSESDPMYRAEDIRVKIW